MHKTHEEMLEKEPYYANIDFFFKYSNMFGGNRGIQIKYLGKSWYSNMNHDIMVFKYEFLKIFIYPFHIEDLGA